MSLGVSVVREEDYQVCRQGVRGSDENKLYGLAEMSKSISVSKMVFMSKVDSASMLVSVHKCTGGASDAPCEKKSCYEELARLWMSCCEELARLWMSYEELARLWMSCHEELAR